MPALFFNLQKKEKRSRWSNFQDQKQESNDKAAKSEEAKSDDRYYNTEYLIKKQLYFMTV